MPSQAFMISPCSFRLATKAKKEHVSVNHRQFPPLSSFLLPPPPPPIVAIIFIQKRLREGKAWAMAMHNTRPGAPSSSSPQPSRYQPLDKFDFTVILSLLTSSLINTARLTPSFVSSSTSSATTSPYLHRNCTPLLPSAPLPQFLDVPFCQAVN